MCRAPFLIVFMATLLGASCSVPAHQGVTASTASPAGASLERLDSKNAVRSNTVLTPRQNPASSKIIPSAYRDVDRVAPSPALNPIARQTMQINSGWRYTAALLGTLGIIGTIAVRRRKPGKPWA